VAPHCDTRDAPAIRARRAVPPTLVRVTDFPIGVFDSGYGGLTVMRAILDQLPHESVAYFGDTARAPYGPRPIAQTRELALECLDRLVDHGVKVLVIACNTASAAVLHDARERYGVPVVEVIRPAVRRAAAATRRGRVGVISTLGTHQSGAYLDAFAAAPHLDVVSLPCPRFVEFVERGVTGGAELVGVAHEYLDPLRERGVDTLVLGCTHYPLLTAVISYVMGDGVTLVSSAEETAKDVYRVLSDADLLRPDDLPPPDHGFTTTGDPDEFRRLATRFLGVGSRLGPVFTSPPTVHRAALA
jgi:glutamate racemase